jgi:hypothetical protein
MIRFYAQCKVACVLVSLVMLTTCTFQTRAPMMKFQTVTSVHRCNPERSFPQMVRLPFFGQAAQVVNSCSLYPNHNVSLALLVFYYTWLEYFGDNEYVISNLLDEVMISWGAEKKTIKSAYNVSGELVTNRNILGMVVSKRVIWVYQKGRFDTNKISDTSLIHELVHISIRATTGASGDPDHEGNKYSGWTPAHTQLINEANGVLRSYDL